MSSALNNLRLNLEYGLLIKKSIHQVSDVAKEKLVSKSSATPFNIK